MKPKIPNMARGTLLPYHVQERLLEEAKEKEAIRQQRRHDYRIATFGIIGGFVAGLISSFIVLWLQGLL